MDLTRKVTVSWSGGKDALLALDTILREMPSAQITHLHCMLQANSRTVGLHGIPEQMITRQADAIALPLVRYYVPDSGDNGAYRKVMEEACSDFRRKGITDILYGDIFLEDLRRFRIQVLEGTGLNPMFPLWKRDSRDCLESLVRQGYKCVVCAANEACYNAGLLGSVIDSNFIRNLPEGVDPSGENGEFHTFVYDGPMFRYPVAYSLGSVSSKKYMFRVVDKGNQPGEKEVRFYFQEFKP